MTLRAVKHLDVIEHITTSILLHGVNFLFDTFPFQQPEEALSFGIVMVVSSTAHACYRLLAFKNSANESYYIGCPDQSESSPPASVFGSKSPSEALH